jgi:hypothetical protein
MKGVAARTGESARLRRRNPVFCCKRAMAIQARKLNKEVQKPGNWTKG